MSHNAVSKYKKKHKTELTKIFFCITKVTMRENRTVHPVREGWSGGSNGCCRGTKQPGPRLQRRSPILHPSPTRVKNHTYTRHYCICQIKKCIYLRRCTPAVWAPRACRCSGDSRWACGTFSCWSCARGRLGSRLRPTPWSQTHRGTVHARFSPWIYTRHTHITCLRDLGTVHVHCGAVGYPWNSELHA